MTYNIQFHAIDGSDGGVIQEGFASAMEAKEWAEVNINFSEFEGDILQIHEEDGDRYGEAVEDLN